MEEEIFFEERSLVYESKKDFTTLHCWRDARELTLFCYNKVVPVLPKSESYNLTSQIKRAAISSTPNIAEGYRRFNYQESIQFYRISRASIYEIKDHLISCYDLKYINRNLLDEGFSLIEAAKIKLGGLYQFC